MSWSSWIIWPSKGLIIIVDTWDSLYHSSESPKTVQRSLTCFTGICHELVNIVRYKEKFCCLERIWPSVLRVQAARHIHQETHFDILLWRAGRSGGRLPLRARFSTPVQIGPAAQPASYVMGTRLFPGLQRPGRDVDHPPPSSIEVKETVELYLRLSSLRALLAGYMFVHVHKVTAHIRAECGRDSSVGIATRDGLDGPKIEFQWERDFLYPSWPAMGPTHTPIQWVPSPSRG
jgi:hypothetical protein